MKKNHNHPAYWVDWKYVSSVDTEKLKFFTQSVLIIVMDTVLVVFFHFQMTKYWWSWVKSTISWLAMRCILSTEAKFPLNLLNIWQKHCQDCFFKPVFQLPNYKHSYKYCNNRMHWVGLNCVLSVDTPKSFFLHFFDWL